MGLNSNNLRRKSSMDIGIMILLVCLVIFFGRCIYIMKNNSERGGLAYVELLNFSMPLVKTQVYDEEAYYENNFSLKNIALEALGLSDLSLEKLVSNEIPMFKIDDYVKENKEDSGYSPFELDSESIIKYTSEEKNNLYNPKLKKELNQSKPEVLIYHTHTGEGYSETKNFTDDSNHNVVGVGEIITKELEENYGISVIHDKTVHDVSYNDSYNRSRDTVKKYYDKYGDNFKLVIDIHRDGIDKKKATNRTKDLFTVNINKQSMARIMFLNTRGSSKFSSNEKMRKNLYNIANSLYPGLVTSETWNRGINLLNQDILSNSILFEVGSNINTSKEAMTSAKYIARVIAEYINGK
ncbi:stage II sporulation protein P [Clostridium sp.]|uniref:stage II sporulation protein P n=1 Tax=Clostridium sp. TaxID=1506 RepID=UPI0026DA928B|nr:stage II sporulation protein P [Clostridium sp.]MDO5038754.1 stage II sporulation protein P [Clostridium sp.]